MIVSMIGPAVSLPAFVAVIAIIAVGPVLSIRHPGTRVETMSVQRLGESFELRVRQSATFSLAGREFKVRFDRVIEDSRCPVDVTCVWEGDAVARFELIDDAGSASLDLHTNGRFEQEREHRGIRLRLVRLSPVPRSDKAPRQEDYVATVIADRVSEGGPGVDEGAAAGAG
jgi:hypothetical protein